MKTPSLHRSLRLALLLGLWLVPVGTLLADYNLAESVIAAGGGQLSGSGWTLNATIGQPAAGTTAGGGYTLSAGFWPALAAQPLLSIQVSGNSVILSWPSAAVGFVLQQTSGLDPAAWTPVNITPTDNGVVKSVTLDTSAGIMFYRLAR